MLVCTLLVAPLKGVALASFEKTIVSVSGEVTLSLSLKDERFTYAVTYRNELLIRPSQLGMVWQSQDSLLSFSFEGIELSSKNEQWQPVWGQYSNIRNQYNECLVHLKALNSGRLLDLRFRVYDDGVGFRYEIPEKIPSVVIMSEETHFRFAENFDCWWIWADYNTLEKLYQQSPVKQASQVAAPFTLRSKNGNYLSIYEAAIGDYSTMTLKQEASDSLQFRTQLVPWADGSLVKTSAPFTTPWRVIQLSATAGGLIESSLILNFNEASVIADASWIQPMTYIGIWWEMHLGLSSWGMAGGRHGGNNGECETLY